MSEHQRADGQLGDRMQVASQPTEECTAVREYPRNCKHRGSRVLAHEWLVSCESWDELLEDLIIGPAPREATPAHGWPRTAWIGT